MAEKICKNCRYFGETHLPEPLDDYYFCYQSTEHLKQYVKADDWCDRFTNTSWVNKENIEVAPFPDNATNGDVIKALFPNKQFVSICSDRIYDFTTDNKINCELEWWDAPYKEQ